MNISLCIFLFKPVVPNAPFLYPLKTSENLMVLMFSGGRERVHWEQIGLHSLSIHLLPGRTHFSEKCFLFFILAYLHLQTSNLMQVMLSLKDDHHSNLRLSSFSHFRYVDSFAFFNIFFGLK